MSCVGKFILICGLALCMTSCMKYGPAQSEVFGNDGVRAGLFVSNEGNFMYGNASLSFYDIQSKDVENDVFSRANSISLGDVAQSMTLYQGTLYIVVNNSGVIFAIDPQTFKIKGVITGFVSPRYLQVVNSTKAYVTDLYASCIWVVNLQNYTISGAIPTVGHRSTEQMVLLGTEVFVSCWSYDNTLLVVDTQTDSLCDSLDLGIQPKCMALDKNQKLWVLSDGTTAADIYTNSTPCLYRINPATRRIEQEHVLPYANANVSLCLNGTRDTLYYLNHHVWRTEVTQPQLPSDPFLSAGETLYYALTVDPYTSHVYVADAVDYVQSGIISRYTAQGALTDTFTVGIIPGAFCFVAQE